MVAHITLEDFIHEMQELSKSESENHFSTEGLKALFEYLELTADLEEYVLFSEDLYVIYREFESVTELFDAYYRFETLDDFRKETTVIEVPGGGVIIGKV